MQTWASSSAIVIARVLLRSVNRRTEEWTTRSVVSADGWGGREREKRKGGIVGWRGCLVFGCSTHPAQKNFRFWLTVRTCDSLVNRPTFCT